MGSEGWRLLFPMAEEERDVGSYFFGRDRDPWLRNGEEDVKEDLKEEGKTEPRHPSPAPPPPSCPPPISPPACCFRRVCWCGGAHMCRRVFVCVPSCARVSACAWSR